MASNEISSTLNDLYQQLKDLDLLDEELREQRNAIYRRIWDEQGDQDPEVYFDLTESAREQHRENFACLFKTTEALRTSIRRTINIVSRPTLQPLGIM